MFSLGSLFPPSGLEWLLRFVSGAPPLSTLLRGAALSHIIIRFRMPITPSHACAYMCTPQPCHNSSYYPLRGVLRRHVSERLPPFGLVLVASSPFGLVYQLLCRNNSYHEFTHERAPPTTSSYLGHDYQN